MAGCPEVERQIRAEEEGMAAAAKQGLGMLKEEVDDDAGHVGHLDPWDAVWGQRYATLHDPDGNSVDLFAALP